MASIAFATSHAVQSIAKGFFGKSSIRINPSGFIILVPFEIIQLVVFLVIGYPLGYVSAKMSREFLGSRGCVKSGWFVGSGMLLGILFLPLCASVPFFLFRTPDDPVYSSRCLEFAFPMIAAGAVGGGVFWRAERKARRASSGVIVNNSR